MPLTRHSLFVVLSSLVGAVDVDREIDIPCVTVDFVVEVVVDHTAPTSTQFGLNLLAPLHVGMTYA